MYCATKAYATKVVLVWKECLSIRGRFMHSWTMSLRTQLKHTNVRVVEIAPPLVESDLHRDHKDWNDQSSSTPPAMSMNDFMAGVAEGLQANKDTISAGPGNFVVDKWFETFGAMYDGATRSYSPPAAK